MSDPASTTTTTTTRSVLAAASHLSDEDKRELLRHLQQQLGLQGGAAAAAAGDDHHHQQSPVPATTSNVHASAFTHDFKQPQASGPPSSSSHDASAAAAPAALTKAALRGMDSRAGSLVNSLTSTSSSVSSSGGGGPPGPAGRVASFPSASSSASAYGYGFTSAMRALPPHAGLVSSGGSLSAFGADAGTTPSSLVSSMVHPGLVSSSGSLNEYQSDQEEELIHRSFDSATEENGVAATAALSKSGGARYSLPLALNASALSEIPEESTYRTSSRASGHKTNLSNGSATTEEEHKEAATSAPGGAPVLLDADSSSESRRAAARRHRRRSHLPPLQQAETTHLHSLWLASSNGTQVQPLLREIAASNHCSLLDLEVLKFESELESKPFGSLKPGQTEPSQRAVQAWTEWYEDARKMLWKLDYTLLRQVGSGLYGRVYQAKRKAWPESADASDVAASTSEDYVCIKLIDLTSIKLVPSTKEQARRRNRQNSEANPGAGSGGGSSPQQSHHSSGSSNGGGGSGGGGDLDRYTPQMAYDTILSEIDRWSSSAVSCRNLLHLHGAELVRTAGDQAQQLWIVSDWMSHGSLSTLLSRHNGHLAGLASEADLLACKPAMSERVLAFVARECLKGLKQLYLASSFSNANGAVSSGHGSLTPRHILLSSSGTVALSDRTVQAELDQTFKPDALSLIYSQPPETLTADRVTHHAAVDVFQLGVCLIECFEGRTPWRDGKTGTILPAMKLCVLMPRLATPELKHPAASPAFKDFVRRCCARKPEERAGVEDLMQHELIQRVDEGEARKELLELAKA